MSKDYVIAVMSKDRVGIIAGLSSKILQMDGNLENLSQTVMRGYFTMMVLASFANNLSREDILQALKSVEELSDAEISLREYSRDMPVPDTHPDNQYIVTASGPDQAGLVAGVTAHLRERDINIIDLSTAISQGTYLMMLLVEIPKDIDISKLKKSLQLNMDALGMKVEIRHQALFKKTNDI